MFNLELIRKNIFLNKNPQDSFGISLKIQENKPTNKTMLKLGLGVKHNCGGAGLSENHNVFHVQHICLTLINVKKVACVSGLGHTTESFACDKLVAYNVPRSHVSNPGGP